MGNINHEQNTNQLFQIIRNSYEEVKHISKGVVLNSKKDKNTYLLKEYTFANQSVFRNKEKQIKAQIQHGSKEYVITPVQVQSRIFSNFCSTSYKVYAIFQYPQITLKEQILERQKQNKSFEEAQLWSILQSCTNALSELKPIVSLNPKQIYINPEGHIKIINDDLIDENYRIMMNEGVYYAPQKLKNFNKLDTQLSLRKQSIFSMGMTILEAAQLSEVSSCYNYNDSYFSQTIMMDMLDFLSQKYSTEFVQILANILQPNPNRRASLMEVQKVLDNFWNAEEEQSMEPNYEESKGFTQLAQNGGQSVMQQFPLGERSMNQQVVVNQKESARKQMALTQKQTQVISKPVLYNLNEPAAIVPQEMAPITPKNPITMNQNNLYTDPKILEMIKKDLEDINKLKHSAFYQTSKYTFMYPQTQSILNSIKNFDTQTKLNRQIGQFDSVTPTIIQEEERVSIQRHSDPPVMMKKNNNSELVYTVQSFQDGRSYEGTILHGKKHGKGKLLFEDGAYYEGEFNQDKMNGHGTLFYREGYPAYQGQWCNDQFNGRGILYNQSPHNLDCQLNFGDLNDIQECWVRYEGQFSYDNKHGKGFLVLTNGQTFEGQFKDDCISGKGIYTCMSGKRIEGEWDTNNLVRIFHEQ